MAYSKTTWLDRAVQFANRFTKSSETSTSVTLTQDPGTVTQAGTPVNATNLNKLEQGVFDAAAAADAALPKAGGTMTGSSVFNNNVSISAKTTGGVTKQLAILYTDDKFYFGDSTLPTNINSNGTFTHKGNAVWDTSQLRTTNGYVEWNNGGTWQGVGGVKSAQRGTANIPASGSPLTITISAINTAKAFVNTPFAASASASVYFEITSSTTIKLTNSGSGSGTTVPWEVVEFY